MLDASLLPQFTDLTLILTDQCNLSCPFCYVSQRGEGGRRMPRELALQAVDLLLERAPAGAPLSVSFFGGEPFLEPALMAAVIEHGLARRPDLRFTTPTNGTLVEGEALELVRSNPFHLALSVDPGDDAHALSRLEDRIDALREVTSITRMTITPDNVGGTLETIQELFARGLSNIMHQPALERHWPAEAVQTWREQHEAIADWACQRYARREPMPELTVLVGIVSRLERGTPAGFCGVGSSQLAVDPAGRIFGCFRSAYDPRAERMILADLVHETVNEPLLAAYARLDPARAQPEQGPCKACPSRDGCTVYCPASGHAVCGDLRAVPADACALMQIQVETCRVMLRRMKRSDRALRRRVGAQVAAAALAVGLAGGLSGCDDDTTPTSQDGAVGGVCPVQVDGAVKKDGPVGGVCPVQADTGPKPDAPVGGVCPVQADTGPKPDAPVGGVCPVKPDLGLKPDAPMGGICPIKPDQGLKPDGPMGGVCPFPGVC